MDIYCVSTVGELYGKGQDISLLKTQFFLDFIKDMPYYHVFTQNSLKHMKDVTEEDLINDHLHKR